MKLPVPRRPSSRGVALTVIGLLLPMQGGCLCGCAAASAREGRAGVTSPVCREVSRRPPTPPPESKGEMK
ncbi:MAG: hypothetical protein ABGY75_13960 [Gemmataceae bacterium]